MEERRLINVAHFYNVYIYFTSIFMHYQIKIVLFSRQVVFIPSLAQMGEFNERPVILETAVAHENSSLRFSFRMRYNKRDITKLVRTFLLQRILNEKINEIFRAQLPFLG